MKHRSLPPAFKMIGFIIILLTLLIPLALKLFNIVPINKIISADKTLYFQIDRSVFFAGFMLILLAREKIEDEFADFCRLTAFRLTFLFGLFSIIVNPIPLFKNNDLNSSYGLLCIQCIFYIIIFYATKKGLIRYEK